MTEEQSKRVLELLIEMVCQHCADYSRQWTYFSGFISTHADAIELLCELGIMEALHERSGRDISAKFKDNWKFPW